MENHTDLLIAMLLFLWECSSCGHEQETRETSRAFSAPQERSKLIHPGKDVGY